MAETMRDIMNPGLKEKVSPNFPHAPEEWTPERAEQLAAEEAITLTPDHWEMLRSLHSYYSKSGRPRARELHDALEELYYARGGLKHLYELFPGGPVAQGCRLAGLEVPSGAQDKSFGSVQ